MTQRLTDRQLEAALAAAPDLARLPQALVREADLRVAAAGDLLARQGGTIASLPYVLSGALALTRIARDGSDIVLESTAQGFVAMAGIETRAWQGDVVAESATRYLCFAAQPFFLALASDAAFAAVWRDLLAREVARLRERCARMTLKSSQERVLHFIETEGCDGVVNVDRPIRSWAAELGLTREALHRALRRLADRGAIKVEGRLYRLA